MSRRKGLLDLPNELLMMIKHELDPYDILGNMCYYTLSARTKACYDDTTEDQWRQMVRANGLGLVTGEDTFDADWEAIAVECAEHAWQCTHPGCGVAQIQTNQATIRWAVNAWSSTGWTSSDLAKRDSGLVVAPSTVFKHTSFNDRYSARGTLAPSGGEIGQIAFLRHECRNDVNGYAWAHGDLLDVHPVASRTFATIPPVPKIDFVNLEDFYEDIRNDGGVTVKDVLSGIGKILERPMSTVELACYLDGVQCKPECRVFHPMWLQDDPLRAVRDVGDWFKLVHWDGFTHEETNPVSGTRFLCFVFKPKPLPEDVDIHLGRYAKRL